MEIKRSLGIVFFSAVLALIFTGCATQQEKINAMNDVNKAFQKEYERILEERGTRVFRASRSQAFNAMKATMAELKFRIIEQDQSTGYLNARGRAPSPLSPKEWDWAMETDLPYMRSIVKEHVGLLASAAKFEPESLDVVLNILTIDIVRGVEVSATMRLREVAPPKTGFPHREYPPPTAFKMGLEKLWRTFERHLKAGSAG